MTKIFSSGAAELFPWLYFVRWKATAFFIGKSCRSYLIERWNRCVTSSTWSSNFSHLTLDTYAFFNGVEESTSFLRLLFLRTLPQILVSNNPASLTQFPFFRRLRKRVAFAGLITTFEIDHHKKGCLLSRLSFRLASRDPMRNVVAFPAGNSKLAAESVFIIHTFWCMNLAFRM